MFNPAKALISNYTFGTSTGNYLAISGTTFTSGTWDDSSSALITIPFSFNYNGSLYTTLSINSNGYITMGAIPATVYCGLQSSPLNTIAGYGTDLVGASAGSSIQYTTRGVTPNRQFVAQWSDCDHYGNSNVNHWTFQIVLNETSNTVQVVWGSSTDVTTMGANTCADTGTESGNVGLLGSSTSDFNIRMVTNGSNTWATSVLGANLSSVCNISSSNIPALGLTYTWTPGAIIPMSYNSSTTAFVNNGQSVSQGTTGNPVIQVQVSVTGTTSPFVISSLSLSTTGSTNPLMDITNAKVYFTGIISIFNSSTPFGSTVVNPNGAYTVTGSATLSEGINYFWVTYDIKNTSTLGDVLAGCASQIVGSGSMGTVVPSITCPSGTQTIASVGSWTALTNVSPNASGGLMLLLSDGTVMAKNTAGGGDGIGNGWSKLTPDIHGSYINGTWSALASMTSTRLYFSSQVLKDGRIYVAGGEYGTGGSLGEVYNPVTNTWSNTAAPGSVVSDANSEILPDGRVLQALVNGSLTGTLIYNPILNTYINGPTALGIHNESAWVKLADNSVLYINRLSTASERYIPATNTWVNDATVPVQLYDAFGDEAGAAILLPDGRALFLGSSGHNAFYTPSGTASPGSWAAAADFPGAKGAPDAPAAMMVNGKILCAVSPVPTSANHFPSPTTFYEFNYLTNTFTSILAPGGSASLNHGSYIANMLDLPNGGILYNDQGSQQYYVYTPGGTPLISGKPTVATITSIGCTTYKITGTLFNGISEGAGYGDDWQMATNYPVIRLTSGTNIYYVRTSNWNSTGLLRGSAADTATFDLPVGLPAGTYSLEVTANGIASSPFTFVYSSGSSPTLSSSLTPPAICTNTTFTYTPTSTTSGATFTWTRAAVSGISNAAITSAQSSNPNEVLINTTSSPINVIYVYTITTSGCGSNTQNVTVTVNPLPTSSTITAGGSTTFCAGGNVLLNGNTTSGTWSIGGGTTSTLTATTAGDYFVTTTNSCGTTTSNHINVIVNALPSVTFSGLASSYNLSDPAVNLTGSPSGGSFSGIGISGNTFSPSTAGVGGPYTIIYNYADGNGCSNSFSQQTTITNCVAPAQPGTISVSGGTVKVCPGDVRTYKVTVVSGATIYNWTIPTGTNISSGAGTNSIILTFNSGFVAAGVISVTAGNACGTSLAKTLTINRNTPSIPSVISGTANSCAGTSGTFSVTNVIGVTYNWTAPVNTTIVSGQGTNSIILNFLSTFKTGTLTVNGSNACSTSTNRSLAIFGKPSTPGLISGPVNNNCNTTSTYSIVAITHATSYTWTTSVPGAVITGSGTTVQIAFPTFNSGTVSVTANNACGSSTAKTLSVKGIVATPLVQGNTSVTSCLDQTYTTPAVTGATSYLWTVPSGNTIVSGQGSTSILVHFGGASGNITLKAVNACGNSTASTLAIIINGCVRTTSGITTLTNVNVYPNPSNGKINLELNTDHESKFIISVIDMMGKQIISLNHKVSIGRNNLEIDLSSFANGIYTLHIVDGNSENNLRVILQ